MEDFVGDHTGGTAQDLEDLRGEQLHGAGQAGLGVTTLDGHGDLTGTGIDAADADLDLLGSDLADDQAVLPADMTGDGLVKGIACGLHGGGVGNAVQAQHRETPVLPVALAYPSAAWAAPCS